jgi:DNA invertase Pin-like site-specific DNA recombinase
MAEFERDLIRERVRTGLANARSRGQKLGRPKIRHDRDKHAKIVRQMRAEVESYAEIADALGPDENQTSSVFASRWDGSRSGQAL